MLIAIFYVASVIFSSIVCDDVTGVSGSSTAISDTTTINVNNMSFSNFSTTTTSPLVSYTPCAGRGPGCVKFLKKPKEEYLSKHTIMAVFSPLIRDPGACKYIEATRKQNHQCRKDFGLVEAIKEAHQLAVNHCEEQFRYDRWNCSIETRGKRNIFKKLYKETALVHAITAAAMTHSVARACSQGFMTKCSCGKGRNGGDTAQKKWRWGGCNDNVKHGKRVSRSFLDLRADDGEEVTELLRHDAEVGIHAVTSLMVEKCKCHGVSGSCSMKTCWKKMADFNSTASLLREKYYQAIRRNPSSSRSDRRDPSSLKRSARKRAQTYSTLYYLETSPTFCAVTKDRRCINSDNCKTLCCGRGYSTKVFRQIEKCRCRFENGRCCHVICDYCQRLEDRFFCK